MRRAITVGACILFASWLCLHGLSHFRAEYSALVDKVSDARETLSSTNCAKHSRYTTCRDAARDAGISPLVEAVDLTTMHLAADLFGYSMLVGHAADGDSLANSFSTTVGKVLWMVFGCGAIVLVMFLRMYCPVTQKRE